MPESTRFKGALLPLSMFLALYMFCNQNCLPVLSQPADLQAYMPTVSPEMLHYSHAKYVVYFLQFAIETFAIYLFLQFGLAHALQERAQNCSRHLFLQMLVFVPVFHLFLFAVNLPLRLYGSFYLDHSMHLSDQSLWGWMLDRSKLMGMDLALEIPLAFLLFCAFKRFPKAWPYLAFVVSLPLIWLAVFAAPLLFDPVLNEFTPMPESRLRHEIVALAGKAGLPKAAIFVSNHSKQSKKIDAYVTGVGASARIVLFDTTLKTLPDDEILAIAGHELGHRVLNHINSGCLGAALFSLLLLPFNIYVVPVLIRRLPRKWKIQSLDDIAVIPLIVLAGVLVSFLADPIINAYSRKIEHDADAFGLHLTKNGPAMARLFVALSEQNLSEPDPNELIKIWYFSHPSLKERIQFSLTPGSEACPEPNSKEH